MSEPTEQKKERSRILRWLEDATDASILVIPRFLGLLYGPLQDRLPLGDAWRASMRRKVPAFVGWKHAFGGATYFLLMILIATGVMLSFYYRPSAAEAYQSLQYLESEVPFGWLIRHAHFWAASLVVLTTLVHLFRVLYTGTYRRPRETTWLMGILLLITLLAFVTSGYLLPWDQWAYWSTTDGLGHLEGIPLIGGLVASLFRVDESVSGATLSRFYATHVILLPWVLLLLLSLHFQLVRKHGVAPVEGEDEGKGEPFFPNHMLRQLVVVFITLMVIVTMAAFRPRPFGVPADPFTVPEQVPPLGFPAAILLGAGHLPGGLGLIGFPLLLVALALLPVVVRNKAEALRKRPVALTLFALFALLLIASLAVGLTSGGVDWVGGH